MSKSTYKDNTVQVKIKDEQIAPVLSNNVGVGHTEDYFVLDFIYTGEPSGFLISRIALTPQHMVTFLKAIEDNLNKWKDEYEIS